MIEGFFINNAPSNAESGVFNYWLVALSYIIASYASYTAFTLATKLRQESSVKLQRVWHYGGAFAMGAGIWSMHFVGMLSYKMDMSLEYNFSLTFLSMILAIGVAYFALNIVKAPTLNFTTIAISAVLLGIGICGMHYLGMEAMDMDGDIKYLKDIFIISVIIAIVASAAALWLLFTLTHHTSKWSNYYIAFSALIMGAAICGMHYTGMAATVFVPWAECRYDPTQTFEGLALTIGLITITILFVTHFSESIIEVFTTKDLGKQVFLQLSSLLSFLILATVMSYIILFENLDKRENDAAIINSVGLQRMLIQRYTREVSMALAGKHHSDSQVVLASNKSAQITQKHINKNFNAFLDGGNIIVTAEGNNTIFIPPINSISVKDAIRNAQKEWKKLTKIIASSSTPEAEALTQTSQLLKLSKQANITVLAQDQATRLVQQYIEQNAEQIERNQFYIILICLLFYAATIYYAYHKVSLPLSFTTKSLENHRDNLQRLVNEQTSTLQKKASTVSALLNIAEEVHKANTLDDAIQECLNALCNYMEWSIGHMYILDQESNQLTSTKIWYFDNKKQFKDFKKQSEKKHYQPGMGFPGKVLKTKKALWIPDILNDTSFQRQQYLPQDSVKSYVAFPVMEGKKVTAVLEFFTRQDTKINDTIHHIAENISSQLGIVKEKWDAQKQLKAAVAEAESANRAKSDFLATMSHEIRTPMNAILGMTGLLTETKQTSEQKQWTSVIQRSGNALLDIINDILDFSKINAGELTLEPINFNLLRIVEDVTDLLSIRAKESQVELLCEIDKTVPEFVVGDPGRIRQIILNLASNAIKFTENGHVLIRIFTKQKAQKNNIRIYFEVEDTGIGIPEDKQDYIFNKFSQAEESTTRKFGGTGLGLSISQHLVSMMDGHIGVNSDLGKGSTFFFDIVLPIGEKTAQKSTSPNIDFSKLTVAVIDDYKPNLDIITHYLNDLGASCDAFENSEDALKAIKNKAKSKKPYDIAFIDFELDNMNGVELGKKITSLKTTKELINILMSSCISNSESQNTTTFEKAGFGAYLLKPLQPKHIKEAMALLLDAKENNANIPFVTKQYIEEIRNPITASETNSQELKFNKARVLAVDDMKVNLMLLLKFFEKLGCHVDSAANGIEAVQMMKQFDYDIVFMDCQMPEMDGFEATQEIRKLEKDIKNHTPIIAITADAMQGDEEKCLAAGMDGYLNKPVKKEDVIKMMEKWIKL